MATYITPGRSEVHWVPSVATITAATTAELNAGTDLTAFVREMPTIPRATNLSDNTDLSATFESRNIGTRGGDSIDVIGKRHVTTGADTFYTTLAEDTTGFLVVARQGIASTAGVFATGDRIDVFQGTVSSLEDGTPGRNDIDTAIAHIAVTAEPSRNQVV